MDITENLSGGQKFVTVNARGDTLAIILRLDADDFRKASNMHIAGHGDLAGQGENKLDGASGQKFRIRQKKVETAETDVPRLSLPFAAVRSAGAD